MPQTPVGNTAMNGNILIMFYIYFVLCGVSFLLLWTNFKKQYLDCCLNLLEKFGHMTQYMFLMRCKLACYCIAEEENEEGKEEIEAENYLNLTMPFVLWTGAIVNHCCPIGTAICLGLVQEIYGGLQAKDKIQWVEIV